MTLFVREYSWMWNDLRLSLAECRVYAYIYGLTHGEKKGYNGSKRHLAELLGLNAGAVKRILDTLKEKHLIVNTEGLWQSVATNNTEAVATDNESVVTDNENVATNNSPHTPLYIDDNKIKKASMQTIFDKFWNLYDVAPEFQNRRAATQMIFEARSIAAQQEMIAALEQNPNMKGSPNPYFFVQDFPEPKPLWLRGDEGGDIVQVRYNGAYKLCTRATMELFGLEFVRNW